MTMSTQAALEAIGRQLDANYLPTLTKPLPRELKHLLAQLVAYETRKRTSVKYDEEHHDGPRRRAATYRG
jgi:hypothetical protein